jgi:hypothetical protein
MDETERPSVNEDGQGYSFTYHICNHGRGRIARDNGDEKDYIHNGI